MTKIKTEIVINWLTVNHYKMKNSAVTRKQCI